MSHLIIYSALFIALISLVFPAWIIAREAYPSYLVLKSRYSFQWWYLVGFVWLLVSLLCRVFVSVMSVINDQQHMIDLFSGLHWRILLSAWLGNCALGTIEWITSREDESMQIGNTVCITFNAGALLYVLIPGLFVHAFTVISGVVAVYALLRVVHYIRQGYTLGALFLLVGVGMACIGVSVNIFQNVIKVFTPQLGISFWVIGSGIVISIAAGLYTVEKMTGDRLYYPQLGYAVLGVLSVYGPFSYLVFAFSPTVMGTIIGVGLGFVGPLIGTNLWMSFDRMRQKTVDELAARWEHLGAWLPAGISSQFIAFGGWCFFIGGLLMVASSFQGFAGHLMDSPWREGLIKLSLIGGSGSFYMAGAYAAWSTKSVTPDAQVAEIGYWHYLGGLSTMLVCLFLAGLVFAAQTAMAGSLPGEAAALINQWQRPFSIGIGVTNIMVFA
ncbi:MAG: hypothetical protein GF384_06430, partial [Elusimicrobia bacterium]|nr:hypothetical protein [Elusimicrobiota bacterium]MBD3412352.1 hypothetical protein [Elusimicrobiota bacterium]